MKVDIRVLVVHLEFLPITNNIQLNQTDQQADLIGALFCHLKNIIWLSHGVIFLILPK